MRPWTLAGVLGAAVVGVAVLAGCGTKSPHGDPMTPGSSASPSAMTVTIERTGGIAGMHERLEISAGGTWVYTNLRTNTTERGTLTAEQRTQLFALIANPAFGRELVASPNTSRVCSDTFMYAFDAGTVVGSFDECYGDERPTVAAVINALADATPL